VKKQRSSFTLLEVIVSMVLVSIVLTFVFTFFRQILTMKTQSFALKEKILNLEYFHARLTHLFDHFHEQENCLVAKIIHDHAHGPALLIQCDNGIHPNPAFSGLCYHMLFKTRDHRLCLCTWSKNDIEQIDTLLTQIKDFSCEFFADKQWHTTWPIDKKNNSLPYMIKISFQLNGDNEKWQDFIFSLSSNEISYEKKLDASSTLLI
jgi:hypothetical protein